MAQPLDLAAVSSFENLEFLARQLVEGFITGLHQSPYHGFSVEFSEHRLYNPGESTRHLDWKVFARTDKLFVKRYEEETNLRCHLLLDVSPSMYYPAPGNDKLRFSILCAAALITLLQKQRDAVGLVTFADQVELQTPVRSTSTHRHTLLLTLQQLLERPPTRRVTDVAHVIHQIAQQIPKRSLVVLFSDMLGRAPEEQTTMLAALQHLRHQHHEVLLFHIMDRATESEFAFADRPYLFEDIETGEQIKLQPNQVRDQYRAAMQRYEQELALRCGQYKIDFVPVDIREPFDKALYAYLVKRGKVR
ncbi:hypothetical protein GCM10011375_36660 [Hymenobacter qilianensis]|uniref:Uncharacterized protein n=1 Tax=Hymenobacter qilianensis TaxID=1385715 RepID=A0ACB5PW76_9BACT|nr:MULTISPECIES: DUF58 domain-containing protein [Hymenobacter]QIL75412.1 DUF58 domain-containing protein [Hymenobacter sp. HDW8]GGF78259.1 hypothetical protein GCM10011375_36660 [Hymenobacter qilianensis]